MNLIKCEKLEKSMAELQFSIDAEAFKKAVADVFKKESKKYAVPGFRKGKAPRSLIEKMYGADVFTYDAINELFPDAYEAAVKEAGIEPVGRPEVSVDSANETEGVTLTVKVAVKPEVKVGNYNGLTVEKTVHTVTDETVDAELKRVQERNARELTREGAAENGDTVDIDFEGFVDGKAFEGGKAERADKKKAGAHAHSEWAPHLNSASEDLTAKLFTLVEVILGVVPVVVIGLFLASKDATSVDKLTDVFSQDPSMVVTFISACLQPFVAYMLYMVYRKYCEGDAGFAAGNLIGLLCSEILLLNIPGVIGMGILLWRVWRNVAPHFESWLFERRAMGVLVDIAGSLVILVLAFMCATAARGLAGM